MRIKVHKELTEGIQQVMMRGLRRRQVWCYRVYEEFRAGSILIQLAHNSPVLKYFNIHHPSFSLLAGKDAFRLVYKTFSLKVNCNKAEMSGASFTSRSTSFPVIFIMTRVNRSEGVVSPCVEILKYRRIVS